MDLEEKKTTPERLPPASGNIWGWKFSLVSLGIIIFMLGLAAYRHWQLGVPFDLRKVGEVPAQDSTLQQQDSVQIDSLQ